METSEFFTENTYSKFYTNPEKKKLGNTIKKLWKVKGINLVNLPQKEIMEEIKNYNGEQSFINIMVLSGINSMTFDDVINHCLLIADCELL
jgi:hypothetical protein